METHYRKYWIKQINQQGRVAFMLQELKTKHKGHNGILTSLLSFVEVFIITIEWKEKIQYK